MSKMRLLVIGCVAMSFALGCGEINVVDTDPLGTPGASCTKTADCKVDLQCRAGVCVDPTKGDEGASCEVNQDCQKPLVCLDNVCSVEGNQNPTGDCPAECRDYDCCYLRQSFGWEPALDCAGCDSAATCSDGKAGFWDPLVCDQSGCLPQTQNYMPQVLEQAGIAFCEAQGSPETFSAYLPVELADQGSSCTDCFLLFYECLSFHCAPECNEMCTPDVFEAESECGSCVYEPAYECFDEFAACSGLSP